MLPQFKNTDLLERALTHRSALNEADSGTPSRVSNERLEFLGDAVLELATTTYLYQRFPHESEGDLTAYRSALVKTSTLAQLASQLKLGQKMYLSKGEEVSGGRSNKSLLADTMEAVIGALYLDQGFRTVERFLQEQLFPMFDEIKRKKLYKDPKSLLQEIIQAKGLPTPEYRLIAEKGPAHDREFTSNVMVGKKVYATGKGPSKQTAQRMAARKALEKLD